MYVCNKILMKMPRNYKVSIILGFYICISFLIGQKRELSHSCSTEWMIVVRNEICG